MGQNRSTQASQLDPEKPLVRRMVERLIDESEPVTLLAVCPNSKAVTRAALWAAHIADAPILFAATLNQVDRDGGYTGWTPAALVRYLREEAARLGVRGPVLPCLDHGGPWMKDAHVAQTLSYDETLTAACRSIEACLDAGYVHLHLDATVDRSLDEGATPEVDVVVERTLELMAHAERYRRRRGLAPVSYEVGSETLGGGSTDTAAFERFLRLLDEGLRERHLEAARPCFVVGRVGTALHTSRFDEATARRLTELLRPYGALLKGHDTDGVAHPEAYPANGMGGANVGPEFTQVEYEAVMELVEQEREHGRDSDLEGTLREAVVESGRWKKWRLPEEHGLAFEELSPPRRRWMLGTCSRYVWADPRVEEARRRLYQHLAPHCDADAHVQHRIGAATLHYLRTFNVTGFNEQLAGI